MFAQTGTSKSKGLSNPLHTISFPIQNNFDFSIPPNNGFRWTLNLMPVIPAPLGKKVNLITRVVLPMISQVSIYGNSSQTGLGDLLVSTFLSPNSCKFVWGVGPSFYFPTGFPKELSAKKWASGPSFIGAIQTRKLMAAALLFHLWSFSGNEQRPDFSYTYFQPLAVYTINRGWGLGLASEIGFEWKKYSTNGSVILTGQKLVKLGGQLINFVLGPKIFFGNFNTPGFGFRATINLLFQ